MMIKAITKYTGTTFERYVIYLWNDTYLWLSADCDSPQGVSCWDADPPWTSGEFQLAAEGNNKLDEYETMINWFDLPKNVQKHVIQRISDEYS